MKQKIGATILSFILLFSLGFGFGCGSYLHAAAAAGYEGQDVMEDLAGTEIDGVPFDAESYTDTEGREPEVLLFSEYGYSTQQAFGGAFALYVYIYTGERIIDVESATGSYYAKIQIGAGGLGYNRYGLLLIDRSENGLFLKMRVNLSESQREEILGALFSGERVYRIGEIELLEKSNYNASAFDVAQTYRFSGFMQGLDASSTVKSTLASTAEGLQEVIKLDITQTCYRPEGDFYNGEQSQLNSCFFKVPERYFADHGELIKIKCEWQEYATKPFLVLENDYLYNALDSLYGRAVENFPSTAYFMITATLSDDGGSWANHRGTVYTASNYHLKESYTWQEGLTFRSFNCGSPDTVLKEQFAGVFPANGAYEKRTVSSQEVQNKLLEYSRKLGGPYYTGKYSQDLFQPYVETNHTRGYNQKTIDRSDLREVFWNTTTKSWWQHVFGGQSVTTQYDTMNAIVEVTGDDIAGSASAVAKRLYVGEGDVSALKSAYDEAQGGEEPGRIVLLRFATSTYHSFPVTSDYCAYDADDPDWRLVKSCYNQWHDGDYTGYMAEETVFLDFDIISLFFQRGEITTEIAAISAPQDVIPGLTPPLEEPPDIWRIIAIVVLVVAIVIVIVVIVVKVRKKNKGTKKRKSKSKRKGKRKKQKRRR